MKTTGEFILFGKQIAEWEWYEADAGKWKAEIHQYTHPNGHKTNGYMTAKQYAVSQNSKHFDIEVSVNYKLIQIRVEVKDHTNAMKWAEEILMKQIMHGATEYVMAGPYM